MIAELEVKFKRLAPVKSNRVIKYDDKSIWRNPETMRKTLSEFIKNRGLKNHTSWKLAYRKITEEQEKKEPKTYREYISAESNELIERKKKAEAEENQEEYKKYKKLVDK